MPASFADITAPEHPTLKDQAMNARDDYAKLHANTTGPHHQGERSKQAQAALDEIDDLRSRLDEAEEKIAYLAAGCLRLDRDELIRKISEVGSGRWQAGSWLQQRVDEAFQRGADSQPVVDVDVVEYAVRYCITRSTYAFDDGLNLAERHWWQLSEATRSDVIAAVHRENPGDHHRWPTIAAKANP